jgi:hypothetical protein
MQRAHACMAEGRNRWAARAFDLKKFAQTVPTKILKWRFSWPNSN